MSNEQAKRNWYEVGDLVEISRGGHVLLCKVESVPSGDRTMFELRDVLTQNMTVAGVFEMRPQSSRALIADRDRFMSAAQELRDDFASVDLPVGRSPQKGTPEYDAVVATLKQIREAPSRLSFDPLRMCVRCDKSIRAGIVGIEDHVEGCPNRATYECHPRHAMTQFVSDHWTGVDKSKLEAERAARFGMELACFDLLKAFPDVDPETPGRMARALCELLSGYDADYKSILKTFPRGDADSGIVIVREIPFASVCEHHVLPFTGTATVAYLPSDRIVGLSKIPRLVDAVTRRLQVQERIGAMVSDALMTHVGARGVMVVIKSKHTCMTLRGAKCPGEMVTSTIRGVFEHDASARAEVLSLIGM